MAIELPARASDAAYRLLRDKVVDLSYLPGTLVNELQLSRDVGLGRMPVREAVARLAREGFLSVVPRRGMVVASMNLTEVLSMLTAREILEIGVVREVCGKASDAELTELKHMFQDVDTAGASGDYLKFLEVDHRAHVRLSELVRNPYLFPLAETLLLHNLRFWRYCYHNRVVADGHVQPHTELVDAVLRRDPEAAQAAIHGLVTTAKSGLQDLF